MTEKEIIQYLKDNKTKGIAFGFMPDEIQDWCRHNQKYLFFGSIEGIWKSVKKHPEVLYKYSVICILTDLEIEYEDFEIDDEGYFNFNDDNYFWCCWNEFLHDYKDEFVGFGGYQYTDCDDWFMSPRILYNDRLLEHYKKMEMDGKKVKPIIPIKIRFFKRM